MAGEPGAGEVVIVPGLGVSAYLRPTVRGLADAGFRCWLVDPPGFGDSADPARPLGVAEIAEAMMVWLDARQLPAVTLIGHSSGTQAVARLAVSAPDRVRSVGQPNPGSALSILADRREPMAAGRHPRTAIADRHPATGMATGRPRRLLHLLRLMKADDLASTLAAVRCPVLVVRGTKDPLCTTTWARQLSTGDKRELAAMAPGG